MIPTAEEFLLKYVKNPDLTSNFKNIIVEFAKLHVEQALKEASEEAYVEVLDYNDYEVNKDSILNAYPLENIK